MALCACSRVATSPRRTSSRSSRWRALVRCPFRRSSSGLPSWPATSWRRSSSSATRSSARPWSPRAAPPVEAFFSGFFLSAPLGLAVRCLLAAPVASDLAARGTLVTEAASIGVASCTGAERSGRPYLPNVSVSRRNRSSGEPSRSDSTWRVTSVRTTSTTSSTTDRLRSSRSSFHCRARSPSASPVESRSRAMLLHPAAGQLGRTRSPRPCSAASRRPRAPPQRYRTDRSPGPRISRRAAR